MLGRLSLILFFSLGLTTAQAFSPAQAPHQKTFVFYWDNRVLIEVTEDGKVVKTFESAQDFSEKDKTTYADAYQALLRHQTGSAPQPLTPEQELSANQKSAEALDLLKKFSPSEATLISKVGNKRVFNFFLKSNLETGDIPNSLEVAVHETTHIYDNEISLTDDFSTFYLISADQVSMPLHGPFNRGHIFEDLSPNQKDRYASAYLEGDGGKQSLATLMSELNAYAHGGLASVLVADGAGIKTNFNAGLAHLMFFLELYLNHARLQNPWAWKEIKTPGRYDLAILSLWRQGESVLEKACDSPLMTIDKTFIRYVYDPKTLGGLKVLLPRESFKTPLPCEKP